MNRRDLFKSAVAAFVAGSMPSAAIYIQRTLTAEEAERFRQEWRRVYKGSAMTANQIRLIG